MVAAFVCRRLYIEAAVWLYAARRWWAAATLVPHLPRLAPHAVVLACAAAAVIGGGFGRPEPSFVMAYGAEGEAVPLVAGSGRLLSAPPLSVSAPRDSLVRPALLTTLPPTKPRFDLIRHAVAPGDTAWSIGEQYSIGMYTVLWSNGLKEDSVLKPGQELTLPPVAGTIHAVAMGDSLDGIARKYSVDPGAVVEGNDLRPGDPLQMGRVLVVPGGALPFEVTAPAPRPRPAVASAPPARAPAAGAAAAQRQPSAPSAQMAAATGRFRWPAGGQLTTYFSGWHPAIDIAAAHGTPILAADGGTVISAGWSSNGYGYRVVIGHGNGYVTTYNHLSAIGVAVGQAVAKGQMIARMGSTGRSSGSHLHFEVMAGNRFVNPLAVLGN